MPRHIQLQGSWNNLAPQSISLLRITFTKDHKGFQTPLRITKPGGGGPRIHGSRLFTFLKKTPCAEFHRKMNESIWTSVYNHSIILTSNGSKHLVKIEYHSYYVGVYKTYSFSIDLSGMFIGGNYVYCLSNDRKKIPTEKLFRIIFLL